MSEGGFSYENQNQQNNEGMLQLFDDHQAVNETYDQQIKEVHQEETVHDSFDHHD